MAKKKKKNAWNKSIAPWIQDNQVWLAAIGGAAGGAALVSAVNTQKGKQIWQDVSSSVQNLTSKIGTSGFTTDDKKLTPGSAAAS